MGKAVQRASCSTSSSCNEPRATSPGRDRKAVQQFVQRAPGVGKTLQQFVQRAPDMEKAVQQFVQRAPNQPMTINIA